MRPFKYTRANEPSLAVRAAVANVESMYVAGGTNILDLMRGCRIAV